MVMIARLEASFLESLTVIFDREILPLSLPRVNATVVALNTMECTLITHSVVIMHGDTIWMTITLPERIAVREMVTI
jgi:hypothetical protein